MSTAEMITTDRETWLAERRRGIGSSDAPIILGQSPFSDPLSLWCQKVGISDESEETEPMYWGNKLESAIAEAYHEKTSRHIERNGRNIFRNSANPWQLATPDFIQKDNDRGFGLLEIKNVNAFAAGDWADGAPLHYQVQVQHQLAVTGHDWGTICVLIGGQQLRWFDVERNESFIESMTKAEAEFWELVKRNTPPQAEPTNDSIKALQRLHPDDNGETIVLPPDAVGWDSELESLKQQIKELEERKDFLSNEIKLRIGAATFGAIEGTGVVYSWKTTERKGYEVKASKSRQLKRAKAKS